MVDWILYIWAFLNVAVAFQTPKTVQCALGRRGKWVQLYVGKSGIYSSDNDKTLDALVVGGGLSGSTAAFYLQQKGLDCRLLEQSSRIGGNVKTRRGNSCGVYLLTVLR